MQTISESDVRQRIAERLDVSDFDGKRVLLVVPDATRTAPLPLLFDAVHGALQPAATKIDVVVALGTHPPMPQEATTPGPTPRGMLGLALALCVLSGLAAIWRSRVLPLSTGLRTAWIVNCFVVGLPALGAMWLLYRPRDDATPAAT